MIRAAALTAAFTVKIMKLKEQVDSQAFFNRMPQGQGLFAPSVGLWPGTLT
jgi:hypothetical protein